MRSSDMENELKSCQKPVITEILMSYPAIKDYRNQAFRLSYPNAKNIEVRRCRVSVLNNPITFHMVEVKVMQSIGPSNRSALQRHRFIIHSLSILLQGTHGYSHMPSFSNPRDPIGTPSPSIQMLMSESLTYPSYVSA